MPLHIETPLLHSPALSDIARTYVWLKMDALQPVGSFKIRGIGHACETYAASGATRFVASSGGNAGIAVAYAGKRLGVPAIIYVPETTTPHAIGQMRAHGAEVLVHGASWQDANERAQQEKTASDVFIHPFDDPLLWQGHSTLVDEIIGAGVTPDAIITVVGGGGLLAGIAQGLERNDLSGCTLIAAETRGAESFHAACRAGEPVTLPGITSIASSLGARRVCRGAFDVTRSLSVESHVITDEQAVTACRRFLADQRILVEPACAAALALVYEDLIEASRFDNLVIEVCGGTICTLEDLQSFPGWGE